MNEYREAYRVIGALLAVAGGVAIVLAEVLNNWAAFVGGIILLIMGATLIAGSGKGRVGRTVRGLIEMITLLP